MENGRRNHTCINVELHSMHTCVYLMHMHFMHAVYNQLTCFGKKEIGGVATDDVAGGMVRGFGIGGMVRGFGIGGMVRGCSEIDTDGVRAAGNIRVP